MTRPNSGHPNSGHFKNKTSKRPPIVRSTLFFYVVFPPYLRPPQNWQMTKSHTELTDKHLKKPSDPILSNIQKMANLKSPYSLDDPISKIPIPGFINTTSEEASGCDYSGLFILNFFLQNNSEIAIISYSFYIVFFHDCKSWDKFSGRISPFWYQIFFKPGRAV